MKINNKINTLKWHPKRRWSERKLTTINKIIIHQELGEGTTEEVNLYHIQPNHISPRGCPHFCYHYSIEKTGDIIQANELKHITWHTAAENLVGIGIMLVGNFAGPRHSLGTSEPAPEQIKSLDFLTGFLQDAFGFSNQEVYGHYHFGKRACPGTVVENWIEGHRKLTKTEFRDIERSLHVLQSSLKELGYYKGSIDNIYGIKTAAAILKFQAGQGLKVDGIPGPETWKKLIQITYKKNNHGIKK